jgi:hypothetical protein
LGKRGCDWLAQRFPDALSIDVQEMSSGFAEGDSPPAPTPRLTVTAEDPDAALQHISELQLAQPLTDLSDEAEERRLVQAACLQIARSRQQLLASMVMLGINRIVVTDSLIHAKVVFAMRAPDFADARRWSHNFVKWEKPSSAPMTT